MHHRGIACQVITEVTHTVGFVIAQNLETCLDIAAYDMPLTMSKSFSKHRRLPFSHDGHRSSDLERWTTQEWEDSLVLQLESIKAPASPGMPVKEGHESESERPMGSTPRRSNWGRSLGRKLSDVQGLLSEMVYGLRRGTSLDTHLKHQGSLSIVSC